MRHRSGWTRSACTGAVARGYGTGVGRSAAGGVHGFPAALTSFIGRARPVGEVAGLLGRYRLVTVTGPGGSGKTRLAGEVAGHVASRFADGVCLAELGPVQDQGPGSGGSRGGAGNPGAAGGASGLCGGAGAGPETLMFAPLPCQGPHRRTGW